VRTDGNTKFEQIDPPGQIYLQGFVSFLREPAYSDPLSQVTQILRVPIEEGQLSAEYIDLGQSKTVYLSFFWIWRHVQQDEQTRLRSLRQSETDEIVRLLKSATGVRSFSVDEWRKVEPNKFGLPLRKFRLKNGEFQTFDPWDGTPNPSP